MVLYNFKSIMVVPASKDFIDIMLSKTQRKTATVCHKGWQISRIRDFYMTKVKFTQQNVGERLGQIIEDFPRLDDIHPFYADLIHVLYSRDHYKLALGQINTARQLVDNIGKDYIKLLKYGDSQYRCKQLKRAALGRMCTLLKKLNSSLLYLEQVRQHLSRLPSIDPNTRTLMITGYPNVGKSSFVNKVTNANVEVQPYAFTTKSVFVGHTDHNYLRWQVIDTPGILDHPLEQRNTIEMQAITALAHLNSCVLFFIDISESCGYSIKQQVSLYKNIKPLFANKPLLIVANKTDLKKFEDLDDEDRKLIDSVSKEENNQLLTMSNISEDGINAVKSTACNMLLQHRVEAKLKGRRVEEVVNRIHVAVPTSRNTTARPPCIPKSVLEAKAKGLKKTRTVTQKQVELEQGGPGVYSFNFKEQYMLANEDWKLDVVPEIIDDKNIADFIDPEIETRLAELEREEEELERQFANQEDMDTFSDLDDEQKQQVKAIRDKILVIKDQQLLDRTNNYPVMPRKSRSRTISQVEANLSQVGLDATKMLARSKSRPVKRARSRARSESREPSRVRSKSRLPTPAPSKMAQFKDASQFKEAQKKLRTAHTKVNQYGNAGEADRRISVKLPKHLYSGKRGIGKTDRR